MGTRLGVWVPANTKYYVANLFLFFRIHSIRSLLSRFPGQAWLRHRRFPQNSAGYASSCAWARRHCNYYADMMGRGEFYDITRLVNFKEACNSMSRVCLLDFNLQITADNLVSGQAASCQGALKEYRYTRRARPV